MLVSAFFLLPGLRTATAGVVVDALLDEDAAGPGDWLGVRASSEGSGGVFDVRVDGFRLMSTLAERLESVEDGVARKGVSPFFKLRD